MYDEDKHVPIILGDGTCMARPPGNLAPCRTAEGCDKGTPEDQKQLTTTNRLAYQHYKGCKATGQFPDDEIVRQTAALIQEAEQSVEKDREDDFQIRMMKTAMLPRGAYG